MINEDIVSYEIAVKLKELGFDMVVSACYVQHEGEAPFVCHSEPREYNMLSGKEEDECPFLRVLCSAPTLAQAQKWLRESKEIDVLVSKEMPAFQIPPYEYVILGAQPYGIQNGLFPTYESALSAGIEAVLKLIEEGEK